jgi:hypothetical protein
MNAEDVNSTYPGDVTLARSVTSNMKYQATDFCRARDSFHQKASSFVVQINREDLRETLVY